MVPRRPESRSIILDCEAVQSLMHEGHPKHRLALSLLKVVDDRSRRQPRPATVLVPVAVRVEAGWDRTAPSSALINRISRAMDWLLTTERADGASRLRAATDVSVVDSTVAQAAAEAPKPVTIITSDADDMTRIKAQIDGDVRVARI